MCVKTAAANEPISVLEIFSDEVKLGDKNAVGVETAQLQRPDPFYDVSNFALCMDFEP